MHALVGPIALTLAAPAAAQQLLWQFDGPSLPVRQVGDVDRDGRDDVVVGASLLAGGDGSVLYDFSGQLLGGAADADGVGDFDGDGVPDVAIIGPWWTIPKIWVFSGATGALVHTGSNGPGSNGGALAALGDVDGDGFGDFVAADHDLFASWGVLSITRGPGLETGYINSTNCANDPGFLDVVGPGDFDGDGVRDWAFTSDDVDGSGTGCLEVRSGTSLVPGSSPVLFVEPIVTSSSNALSEIGDVNGDDVDDLLVGATFTGGLSTVRIYAGGTGTVLLELDVRAEAVAGLGDIDCDGVPDFAVGDWRDDTAGTNAGVVRVYSADGTMLLEVFGDEASGSLGMDVDAAGDVNGDGLPDWIVAGWPYARVYSGIAPPISTYCTAKANSQGCVPVVDATGAASFSSATAFPVTARQVLNNKSGLFFYGTTGRAALPFQGATLCVQPPLQRTPVQSSGGNPPPDDCSGAYLFDFNAWLAGGLDPSLAPGDRVDGQFWTRDPAHPDGTGVGLTDGVEYDLCP